MKIDHNTKLADIQNAFSKKFPHLRLEFYSKRHEPGKGTADRQKLNPEQSLGDLSSTGKEYVLTLDGGTKISEFETLLDKELGLHAQVFRRSGNLWLQTTTTDEWTLDKAEQKGSHSEELSKEIPNVEAELPGQETE